MATLKFTNNAVTTTSARITDTDTVLTLAAGGGALFPTVGAGEYFKVTLQSAAGAQEIVKVTARSVDTLTIVRGQDGTLAAPFPANSRVELRVLAGDLQAVVSDVADVTAEFYILDGIDTTGTTNVTSALAALSSTRMVDAGGGTFLVDDAAYTPPLKLFNGWLAQANIEGDLTAKYALPLTVQQHRITLSDFRRYNAWAQDSCAYWAEKDLVVPMWNEGSAHANGTDMNGVTMRLEGGVWQQKEYVVREPEGVHWCSAAAIVDGMHLVARRDTDTGAYRLFIRRFGERVELTDVLNTGGTGDPYGNAATEFYIEYDDFPAEYGYPALKEGMSATFTSVGAIGGGVISGDYVCSYIRSNRIQFTNPTPFETVELLGGGEFQIVFPETAWEEHAVKRTSGTGLLSEAINDKWVAQGGPSSGAFNIHSMVADSRDAGTFYVGLSGGAFNVAVAKVNRPFDTNSANSVEWVRTIPGATALAEPTLCKDAATGRMYGFCRTQDASTTPPIFFWTDDDFLTVTTTDFGYSYMSQSPIPCAIYGGKIYAMASGTRDNNIANPGAVPADINIYLMQATIADAEADGAAAFIANVPEVMDTVRFENHYFGEANAVGVGSLVITKRGMLYAFYGGELPSETSAAQIFCMERDIKNFGRHGKTRLYSYTAGFWQFYGLPAVVDGGYLTFEYEIGGTAPRILDATTGYIDVPQTGSYEFHLSVAYALGSVGEQYVQLVDSSDTPVVNAFLCRNRVYDATHSGHGTTSFIFNLRRGQSVRLKLTSPNGVFDSIARSFLSIKHLM